MKEKEIQELNEEIEELQPVVRQILTVEDLVGVDPLIRSKRRLEVAQRRLAVLEGKATEPPRTVDPTLDVPKEVSKVHEAFQHSADFRSVFLNGERFTLRKGESKLIEFLASENDGLFPEVSSEEILNAVGTGKDRVRDIFASNRRHIFKKLVRRGERNDTFRLNV